MMQRLFLIPDSEGKETFDASRLRTAIQDLHGVTHWREGSDSVDPEGTLFECELETGDKTTVPIPIQIRKDLTSASIGAFHDEGLQSALDIQRRYGGEVFAFSEKSSPEVVALSAIKSPQELAEKLKLR
ncbi:MAG TPA: hypothetical protein VN952_04885 [Chthoniobacterales bacterium]|nr:hypothetical protein [Chthoniobacterales bacterium]